MTREEWKADWRFCQACGAPMHERAAVVKERFNRKTGQRESLGWCYWECSQYAEGHDQSLYDFERPSVIQERV